MMRKHVVGDLLVELRDGRLDNIEPKLLSLLSDSSPEYADQLLKLLHPLLRNLIVLKKKIPKSDQIEVVCRTYEQLFACHPLFTQIPICLQVLDDLSCFLFRLSDKASKSTFSWATLSEECCLAMVKTIRLIFERLDPKAVMRMYEQENLPLLSHICSVLLEMAENASWRPVRLYALAGLNSMVHPPTYHTDDIDLPVLRTTAHILPGLSQTLYRICTGDIKIGSQVKETALQTWTSVLISLFNRSEESILKSTAIANSPFSAVWYDNARSHIAILLNRLVDELLHNQLELDFAECPRLSVATVQFLAELLTRCPALIDSSGDQKITNVVVSGLVVMAAITAHQSEGTHGCRVHQVATGALMKFAECNHDTVELQCEISSLRLPIPQSIVRSQLIRSITLQTLRDQIASLTSFGTPVLDECRLQKRLRTIWGLSRIMDDQSLSVLVCSHDLLPRLCLSLAELLRFDTNSIEVLDNLAPLEALEPVHISEQNSFCVPYNLFPKSFNAFRNPKTRLLIHNIVGSLAGHESTIDLFCENCRDIVAQTGEDLQNSCLYLISSALAGYIHNSTVDFSQRQIVSVRLISEYFDSECMQSDLGQLSPPDPTYIRSSDPTLKALKQAILTPCLLMELFSTAAQLYSVDPNMLASDRIGAAEELLRIGLLSCASHAARPGLIGHCATHCLRYVAADCGFESIEDLITKNADYLISSITLDLHRVVLFCPNNESASIPEPLINGLRRTCQTLVTLFQYSTFKVLPLLRPMVKQVLTCLDLTYEHHADLFLPALKQLIITCQQWDERVHATQSQSVHTNPHSLDVFTIILEKSERLVAETRRMHGLHRPSGDESVYTTEADEAPSSPVDVTSTDPSSSRLFPDHLHITEEIMLRCIHLLPNQDPKLRLLGLDVLHEGYRTLRHESELLLPLVHKVWLSLMARFRDSQAVVVEKAFQLLLILANVAGDFIRARASSEIIPPLLQFLLRGSTASSGANASYLHLTSYRVQHELLSQMGTFCSQLKLSTEALRPVVNMLMVYLEDSQPKGLQDACVKSLIVLWHIDPGLVWTFLLKQLPSTYLTQPSTNMKSTDCSALDGYAMRISPRRLCELISRLQSIPYESEIGDS